MARIPLATYRIQFHPDFTFYDAAVLTGYLSALGPTHLYASPCFQAAPGSTHGYDVVDPGRVNEELGGAKGHRVLCAALSEHALGQVLDVVPNHMAITGPENAWWWDVLENGTSSTFASYFDVDWSPPEERLADVREKKHQVLHELLASDVSRLTHLMVKICERHLQGLP